MLSTQWSIHVIFTLMKKVFASVYRTYQPYVDIYSSIIWVDIHSSIIWIEGTMGIGRTGLRPGIAPLRALPEGRTGRLVCRS